MHGLLVEGDLAVVHHGTLVVQIQVLLQILPVVLLRRVWVRVVQGLMGRHLVVVLELRQGRAGH